MKFILVGYDWVLVLEALSTSTFHICVIFCLNMDVLGLEKIFCTGLTNIQMSLLSASEAKIGIFDGIKIL